MPRRIDHIGVVVDNLPEARAFLTLLGMTLDHGFDLGRVEAAFYRCGDVMIEVLECKTPEERERRLGTAKARIEHIAIQVDDLAATVDEFASLGIEMTRPQPVRQDNIQSYWTNPDTSDGVMYQLFEELHEAQAGDDRTTATPQPNEVER